MTALGTIASVNPKAVYSLLPRIMEAAEKGSVITRDHAVRILIILYSHKPYTANVFPLLIEQLVSCPTNHLAMYAENAAPLIIEKNRAHFFKAIHGRLKELEKESQRKRIEKLIKKYAES
jgi:hypothetical protein